MVKPTLRGVNVRKIRKSIISGSIIAIVFSLGLTASPALAETQSEGEILIYIKVDGQLVALDQSFIDERTLDLHGATESSPGEVAPSSISWDQWFGCYSLNNEEDMFAEYVQYWDGAVHDVRLKCGNDTWGYKHIRAGKEALWQKTLNEARATGWISQSQGIESWDDLMAATAGVAITWPERTFENAISNKKCGLADAYFINSQTGEVQYVFQVMASWATDSDRLINSYPSTSASC
ncbi:hypothetical protein [Cryobacterium sp. SO1]|uniref:hypothetical protein n=1 Tax=Cryobacterium sp. SO1 TaxID=1897061 RepID=UPI0010233446|nr:hypothetical protein [Cryobacterium sp. SO1]